MSTLNEQGKKVFALKYSTHKTRAWKDACREIANFVSEGERPYGKSDDQIQEISDKYYDYLYNLRFIPGGRILANANTGIKNLANCFVLGIDDSRKSIYSTLKDAAEVFAMGGGVGYSFSKIREEGADIISTGGKASGPLSFMSLFDQTGEVIQQASRRGAQLGSLNVSHPDILKFIQFKAQLNSRNSRVVEEYDRNLKNFDARLKNTKYETVLRKTLLDDQLTHFNISVMLTDAFMEKVKVDGDWDLISPSTGKIVKTVKAREIIEQMAKQAWESGDPGELFFDAINRDNMVRPYMGNIEATNPCGEIPLLEGESCILASINLHQMYNSQLKQIDWDLLADVSRTATRFLEDVTEITEAPLDYINEKTKNLRRLGVGVIGFADLLVELNIPYDSNKAVSLAGQLSWFINYYAWQESFVLGKERGSFEYYDPKLTDMLVVSKVLGDLTGIQVSVGPRNVAVTGLAPTGSIAIIGGVNSCIEPFFALAYKRNITEGIGNIAKDHIYETNPALERKLKEFGYDKETSNKILEYAFENGTLTGCNLVSKEVQLLFKTANEIPWKRHVDIQAAWQKYVSNAISKTINIPEESTPQDIYDIYMYMWEKGLKGGTVYRNRSKSFQVLEKNG